jgi:hypothetical protein
MANLTFYNVAICMVVALGGFAYGFGFAIFVLSLGQPSFYVFFKLDRKFFYPQLEAASRPPEALPGN